MDSTLIEAWSNRRSFHEKKEPPERGSGTRGRKMLRDTHESQTDPESRLYKKSGVGEAKPSYLAHVVMENRSGLIVQPCVTESGRREEWAAALEMLKQVVARRRVSEPVTKTVGADKGYQDQSFIAGVRALGLLPHVAEFAKESKQWPNWLTAQEREHAGFAVSQRIRKLVEKIFGWIKFVAGLRKTKLRGRRRVHWAFCLASTAANLLRMAKLIPERMATG